MKIQVIEDLPALMRPESYQKLQEYLNKVRVDMIRPGEWFYFNESDLVKAIVLEQSNYTSGVKEFHREFADVHITIDGTDTMHYGATCTQTLKPYDATIDAGLVFAETTMTAEIATGCFVLMMPEELHSNLLTDGARKVVLKMKLPNA